MRITESQLRRFIREAIESSSDDRESLISEYERKFRSLIESPAVLRFKKAIADVAREEHELLASGHRFRFEAYFGVNGAFPFGSFDRSPKDWSVDSAARKIVQGMKNELIRGIDLAGAEGRGKDSIRSGLESFYDSIKGDHAEMFASYFAAAQRYFEEEFLEKAEAGLKKAANRVEEEKEKINAQLRMIDEEAGDLVDKIKEAEEEIIRIMAQPGMIQAAAELRMHDPNERLADVAGSEFAGNFRFIRDSMMTHAEFAKALKGDSFEYLKNAALKGRDVRKTAETVLSNLAGAIAPLRKIADIIKGDEAEIERQAEAPPGSPLGRIAFATGRHGKPFEVDTEIEAKLLSAIRNHVEFNHKLKPEFFNLMRELEEAGLYKKIFTKPNPKHEVIYRGITTTKGWVLGNFDPQTLLAMKNRALESEGARPLTFEQFERDMSGYYGIDFKINSVGGTSSWTAVEKIAKSFSKAYIEVEQGRNDYKVVLHTRPADNPGKFINIEGSYLISNLAQFAAQKEYIGAGDIRCIGLELIKIKASDKELDTIPGQNMSRSSPERSRSLGKP